MNFTTAQQIVYGAVLMGDYASECQRKLEMDMEEMPFADGQVRILNNGNY